MAASKRKFKHTRELIKIALDDGMTQEEIGKLCRATQPTVSKWKNGKTRASEQALAPLIKRYGHRLQRATKRVYMLSEEPLKMTVVEGPIVFRCALTRPYPRGIRILDREAIVGGVTNEATRRWLVHQLPGPSFVLVRQQRRCLSDRTFKEQLKQLPMTEQLAPYFHRRWVPSGDDAARWVSEVDSPRSLEELLSFADNYRRYDNSEEGLTVRFLLRKALLEHGHAIAEVEGTRQRDYT